MKRGGFYYCLYAILKGEMEQLSCKVDNQGRITLPVGWRKAHHIEPGNDVSVLLLEDHLEIQTTDQALDEARRIASKYWKGKSALEILTAQRQQDLKDELGEE